MFHRVCSRVFVAMMVIAFACTPLFADTAVRVATYNIKFLDADKLDDQGDRQADLKDVIEKLDADVIGLEEIDDRAALEAVFDPNDWALLIDDDSGNTQDVAMAVRKSKLTVVDFGPNLDADNDDFLFPSPDDNSPFPNRRDVLFAKLKVNGTDDTFSVLVVHAKARRGGRKRTTPRRQHAARLLVQKIERDFEDADFVLLGDWNDTPDDSSLNILESGIPTAPTEMEDDTGEFLVNLTEPLWAAGHISHGFRASDVVGDKLVAVDPDARQRNFDRRNTNSNPSAKNLRNLLDQLLIPPQMLPRYVTGSAKVFDDPVAVRADNRNEWPSDHLPVSAVFRFGGDGPPPPVQELVKIVALLPNPDGIDAGNETITLKNVGPEEIDLEGWSFKDRSENVLELSGTIAAGATRVITVPANTMPLTNSGDAIRLLDPDGREQHSVSYTRDEVHPGEEISFE